MNPGLMEKRMEGYECKSDEQRNASMVERMNDLNEWEMNE